jgi:hypothetical protein
MTTAAILNLFNPPKVTTHYGGYSYKVSWSLMNKGNNKITELRTILQRESQIS